MSAELSLPIATIIASEMVDERHSNICEMVDERHSNICEKIKLMREQVSDFYESESEFNQAIGPIEKDPQSFTSGKPILKKYANLLLEKVDIECRMEAEEEAKRDINLTPQQLKADVKHYVAVCEKKIVKQQELCDSLQKQVEQLIEVVRCLVTFPELKMYEGPVDFNVMEQIGGNKSRLMAHCAMLDTDALDYFIDQGVEIESKNYSALHYAIYAKNITNVKKLLDAGAKVNHVSYLYIDGNHKFTQLPPNPHLGRTAPPLEIASMVGSLELVKLLIEKGASIAIQAVHRVPKGPEGDLVAGYLQTHGSQPITRF